MNSSSSRKERENLRKRAKRAAETDQQSEERRMRARIYNAQNEQRATNARLKRAAQTPEQRAEQHEQRATNARLKRAAETSDDRAKRQQLDYQATRVSRRRTDESLELSLACAIDSRCRASNYISTSRGVTIDEPLGRLTDSSYEGVWTRYNDCRTPSKEELLTYRKDPLMAQKLLWEMSGVHLFEYGDSIVRNEDELSKEISAYEVSDADVRKCVADYKFVMDYGNIKIHYCGSCGVMIRDGNGIQDQGPGSSILKVSDVTILQLSEEQVEEWKGQSPIARSLRSIYTHQHKGNEAYYHLIPDLVQCDRNNEAFIHACRDCKESITKRQSVPPLSISKGFDFGCVWRTSLRTLSTLEKCLISKTRVYADIIKLRAPDNLGGNTRMSALKGHVIAMRHDGLERTVQVLPRLSIHDHIAVYFVGESATWRRTRQNWKDNGILSDMLQVRPDVIMQWLNVLREINSIYAAIPILELTEDTRNLLLDIPDVILDNAHVMEDDVSMRLERHSSSSTAPTVPDHNNADTSDKHDHVSVVDENERILDSVLLNDFDPKTADSTTSEVKLLRAIQKELHRTRQNNDNDASMSTTDLLRESSNSPTEERSTTIPIQRSNQLLNDYTENDQTLYESFPWLFIFGKGLPSSGPLSNHISRRLLLHFNKGFSHEAKLIFLLFNQLQRHSASRMCSAKMYSRKVGVRKFIDTINEPHFDADMAAAIRNPNNRRSKAFLNKLLPNIKSSGHRVPFGPIERQESKYKLYSMCHFFNVPSFFLTVTPNDINSPLCIRMCMRDGDNWTTLHDIQLLSVESRASLVSKNPVAAAVFFQRIVKCAFKHLLGIDLDSKLKTTIPRSAARKGVLSYIIAYFAIIECQGRGTLHTHLFLWGGLPPFLLQKCAEFDDLVRVISGVMDSMLTAEISRDGYDARGARAAPSTRYYPSLHECPVPSTEASSVWEEEFKQRYEAVATAVQVHSHTFTCHKGRQGKIGCRMCYPQSIREVCTGPIELVAHYPTFYVGDIEVKGDLEPKALPTVTPLLQSGIMHDSDQYPLYYPDNRVILWELRRSTVGQDTSYKYHRKNRWVVPYNKAMAATMGTNTATYMLGSAAQAQGALYYIMDYMVKDPTAIVNVLSLIHEARRVTNKYQSVADDRDAMERKATRFLTRIVNNVSVKSEVPVTMAAAALLDMTSTMSSHHFQYVYIEPAVSFLKVTIAEILRQQTINRLNEAFDEEVPMSPTDEHSSSLLEDTTNDDDDDIIMDDAEIPANNAAGELYHVGGKYISVPQHIHYAYRGSELQTFCFQEYICIITVLPMTKPRQQEEGVDGSSNDTTYRNARFHFHRGHPLYLTHIQMIRSSISVPILTGKKPPRISQSADWSQAKKTECAEYYTTLLVPWEIDVSDSFINSFSYDGFNRWCNEMKAASAEDSFIKKCKFGHLNVLARKVLHPERSRLLLNKWRGKSSTKWSDRNNAEGKSTVTEDGDGMPYGCENDVTLEGDCDIEKLMHAVRLYACSREDDSDIQYIKQQTKCLNDLLGDPINFGILEGGSHGGTACLSSSNSVIASFTREEVSTVLNSLSDINKDNSTDYDEEAYGRGGGAEECKGEERTNAILRRQLDISASDKLGHQQNMAFQSILSHIDNVSKETHTGNMLLIVHGGPGVGKSTMAKELVARLRTYGKDVASCAPTGMAASLLVDGRTIHSLFKLRLPKQREASSFNSSIAPLSNEQIISCRSDFEGVAVLLIDEASMIDPSILFHINCRLKQIKDRHTEPFGGLPVVLLGDFFQLKPVKGVAFFDAAMNEIPVRKRATPYAFGCELLQHFKMITFTEQYRSKDPRHTASINQMRQTDNCHGPISHSILDTIKTLSKSDLRPTFDSNGSEIPSPWLTAPIVVTSNRERHEINLSQARRYGKTKGLPVLRWKKQLSVSDDIDEALSSILYENEPDLIGLFVEGAPAHLTANLNASSGLANGTPVVLHSVLLAADDDLSHYRSLVANAEPGEVVDIPVPYAVQVKIPSISVSQFNRKHKSLDSNNVVIPLLNKADSNNKITLEEQVVRFKAHTFQIAFAVTFHKVQGQTVPKIILDLNKRPGRKLGCLDFHGLYVGLTRVEYCDNIRILPCNDSKKFAHLLKLKPNANLKAWLDIVPKL